MREPKHKIIAEFIQKERGKGTKPRRIRREVKKRWGLELDPDVMPRIKEKLNEDLKDTLDNEYESYSKRAVNSFLNLIQPE